MKTSSLYLRPFVPGAVGTELENELLGEPVAKFIYGGVTIEIPLSKIGGLKHAIGLHMVGMCDSLKEWNILSLGLEEIRIEMCMDDEKRDVCLPIVWFRDNPEKCSLRHPWCPIDTRILPQHDQKYYLWDRTLRDHATKWRTPWGKEA